MDLPYFWPGPFCFGWDLPVFIRAGTCLSLAWLDPAIFGRGLFILRLGPLYVWAGTFQFLAGTFFNFGWDISIFGWDLSICGWNLSIFGWDYFRLGPFSIFGWELLFYWWLVAPLRRARLRGQGCRSGGRRRLRTPTAKAEVNNISPARGSTWTRRRAGAGREGGRSREGGRTRGRSRVVEESESVFEEVLVEQLVQNERE